MSFAGGFVRFTDNDIRSGAFRLGICMISGIRKFVVVALVRKTVVLTQGVLKKWILMSSKRQNCDSYLGKTHKYQNPPGRISFFLCEKQIFESQKWKCALNLRNSNIVGGQKRPTRSWGVNNNYYYR